jgi:UDP-N-acetylglucosamine 2-epimerase (non-hydrolysing)
LKEFNHIEMLNASKRIIIAEPLHYIKFMNLIFNCRFAMTDSGGIQEETTYLGIPCITMQPNTERPITVTQGTNKLRHPGIFGSHCR